MSWFESKEDKERRKKQEEINRNYQKEWKEKERIREEEEDDAEERLEYIRELEQELTGNDTDIITIYLINDDCAWRKQIALNFMLKNGYICVQNDVSCTQYSHHYDLTFVKKEHADFFKIG